ncbi:unnamed protein product [Paramecium sonneborni]|uniref:Uncharacterized protein n=1 Tax=Paramecium sonneborni TaxID=65129 RepID=A0A8S1QRK1_9CILI|nr:unnamed protein product [Paramecium sonneborni]
MKNEIQQSKNQSFMQNKERNKVKMIIQQGFLVVRYQFIELLIRIANLKYKRMGMLKMLMKLQYSYGISFM